MTYRDRNNFGVDTALPSEGKIDGMSSFLSDTSILDTVSTPLTLPPTSDLSNRGAEESIGSPQFHSLQRKVQRQARTIRILSVTLTICVIALLFTVFMLLNR